MARFLLNMFIYLTCITVTYAYGADEMSGSKRKVADDTPQSTRKHSRVSQSDNGSSASQQPSTKNVFLKDATEALNNLARHSQVQREVAATNNLARGIDYLYEIDESAERLDRFRLFIRGDFAPYGQYVKGLIKKSFPEQRVITPAVKEFIVQKLQEDRYAGIALAALFYQLSDIFKAFEKQFIKDRSLWHKNLPDTLYQQTLELFTKMNIASQAYALGNARILGRIYRKVPGYFKSMEYRKYDAVLRSSYALELQEKSEENICSVYLRTFNDDEIENKWIDEAISYVSFNKAYEIRFKASVDKFKTAINGILPDDKKKNVFYRLEPDFLRTLSFPDLLLQTQRNNSLCDVMLSFDNE